MTKRIQFKSMPPIELTAGSYGSDIEDNSRKPAGSFTDASGEVVESELPDDFSGVGLFRYANGKLMMQFCTCSFIGVELLSDRAFCLPIGDVYEGEYNDGQRSGNGKCTLAHGLVYQGGFWQDKFDGRGTFEYTNGGDTFAALH